MSSFLLTNLYAQCVQTANAGSDVTVCDNKYVLSANTPLADETGRWSIVYGTGTLEDPTNPITEVSNLSFGKNVFKWTIIKKGCYIVTEDEMEITRLAPISGGKLSAIKSTKICANTNDHEFVVTDIVGTNVVYNWTMPNNVIQKGTGPSIKIDVGNVKAGTSDTLKVSITNNDCPTIVIDLDIILNFNAAPDVSKASIKPVSPICVDNIERQQFEVVGIEGTVDDYGWSAIDPSNPTKLILITETSNPMSVNITQELAFNQNEVSKNIIVHVRAQNSCGTSESVETIVRVDNIPTEATVASPNRDACIVERIILTGNTPTIGTGKWITQQDSEDGTVADIKDGQSELTGLTGGKTFSGTWTISNGVCLSSEANVKITGHGTKDPKISFNVLPSNKICEGEEVTLEANGINGGDNPIYEFLDENGNLLGGSTPSSNSQFRFTPAAGETKVKVKFTSSSSCVTNTSPLITSLETITVQPLENCVITNNQNVEKNAISIYPNPFTSSITLENVPSSVEKVQVVDVVGNVVESVENPASNLELGASLSTGTYFIYLYSTEGVKVEKVVKLN